MTKFLNISTDDTLGGVSPSDEIVASQKAIKTYVDNQGGGGGGADVDLSNITPTGKSTAIGWLVPDYSQGQNVALTGITQWEAPIDCFVSYQS